MVLVIRMRSGSFDVPNFFDEGSGIGSWPVPGPELLVGR
jgi:hypothetical protein